MICYPELATQQCNREQAGGGVHEAQFTICWYCLKEVMGMYYIAPSLLCVFKMSESEVQNKLNALFCGKQNIHTMETKEHAEMDTPCKKKKKKLTSLI